MRGAEASATGVGIADRFEGHDGGINQLFTMVLEVDRHPVADHGLDLADAPVGPVGMAHIGAGNDVDHHGARLGVVAANLQVSEARCSDYTLSPTIPADTPKTVA